MTSFICIVSIKCSKKRKSGHNNVSSYDSVITKRKDIVYIPCRLDSESDVFSELLDRFWRLVGWEN